MYVCDCVLFRFLIIVKESANNTKKFSSVMITFYLKNIIILYSLSIKRSFITTRTTKKKHYFRLVQQPFQR